MGLTYKVAEAKLAELRKWYQTFGCPEDEADAFSRIAFSHTVEPDAEARPAPGWEIEFRMSAVKKSAVAASHKRVYGHWMKSGWNRIGTWENAPEALEQEPGASVQLPLEGWPDAHGASFDYYSYLSKCGRQIEAANLNPQDAAQHLRPENGMALDGLPMEVSASVTDDMLCVATGVVGTWEPMKHHVFVVDVSGSMNSRWVLVQLSMTALFQTLPAGAEVSVIAFADACQVVGTRIAAGDLAGFRRVLAKLPASGGFAGRCPFLQTAYGMLNCAGVNGIVTLFTDGAHRSGFASQEVCNAYLQEQADSRNLLHILAFGSDSWRNEALRGMAVSGKGRLHMVLSPPQLLKIAREHWEIPARPLDGFSIHPSDGRWKLFGGNTEYKGELHGASIVPGCGTAAFFTEYGNLKPGDTAVLKVCWKAPDGSTQQENVTVTVQPASETVRAAERDARAMQRLKDELDGRNAG